MWPRSFQSNPFYSPPDASLRLSVIKRAENFVWLCSYLYANIFYKCLGNNSIKFLLLQTRGLAVKIAIAVEGTDSINLIEDFPLFIRHAKLFRCLDRPSQLARPHLQIWQLVFINEITQSVGELGCERKGEASIYPSLRAFLALLDRYSPVRVKKIGNGED